MRKINMIADGLQRVDAEINLPDALDNCGSLQAGPWAGHVTMLLMHGCLAVVINNVMSDVRWGGMDS